MDVKEIE